MPKYRVVRYLRVEVDEEDLFDSQEEAAKEADHLMFMQKGELIAKVEEVPGSSHGIRQRFMDHLKHASRIVKNWPGWKQNLLGGASSYGID